MARIVVTGIGGPAGRSVVGLLRERGHVVIGTDAKVASLPGVKFLHVPPACDRRFLTELLTIAVRERADLLIPTVSEELPVLAARGPAWQGIPVMLSSRRAVLLANDKYLTCETLTRKGVAVPRFILPSQLDSPGDVAGTIGWPCISKPRVGRGGREVTLLSPSDWPFVASLDDRYLLQEFAAGTDYAPNAYIEPGGGAPIVVVLEKTVLEGGIVGNATEVRRVIAPEVADLAAAAATALGLCGPLDIDIRRRGDGIPVVLEVNARFGANVAEAQEVLDATLAALVTG